MKIVNGQTLSSKEIQDFITNGTQVFQRITVTDHLSFSGQDIKLSLAFFDSEFLGGFTCINTDFGSTFRITRTTVNGDVYLESNIKSFVLINSSVIKGFLSLERAEIEGNLYIVDTEITSDLSLSVAKIQGSLYLNETKVKTLNLLSTYIGGILHFLKLETEEISVRQEMAQRVHLAAPIAPLAVFPPGISREHYTDFIQWDI